MDIFSNDIVSPVIEIHEDFFQNHGVRLFVKREDLIHEHISGNKWRKLKYNIRKALSEKHTKILTFGGAFSNHIAATAFAAKVSGIESIGIIRGEKSSAQNPSMQFAIENNMQMDFVSREEYRQKHTDAFHENLKNKYGKFYLIPEGGANYEGMQGCKEILSDESDFNYDYICCACGTGTTLSGIVNSCENRNVKIIGYTAVNDVETITKNIRIFSSQTQENNWHLNTDYVFGKYAKVNEELKTFANSFTAQTQIPLDYIYTAKMFYGIYDMIKTGYFKKESRILAIHTGGLQGNKGFEYLQKKPFVIVNS